MLGRLVLIIVQLVVGWRLMADFPQVLAYSPVELTGHLELFGYAVLFGLIVWALGLLGALILKDVASPTPSTLLVALIGAFAFAALTLVPDVQAAISRVINLDPKLYPLIGAVLGYAIKR